MDGYSRRAFGALLATLSGSALGAPDAWRFSTDTPGNVAGRTVDTVGQLEAAFRDLSPGDTIRISGENAPYRTTRWLDVDVDGVTVVGPGIQRLVQPADGANVGGIRVGHNRRCREIDIQGVGYHGNPAGQSDGAARLHGIAVEDATNVTIRSCLVRHTHPVRHGDGGSGISVTRRCSGVRVFDTKVEQFGDRGIQLAGERHMVYGNVVTDGLDRPVACDLWPTSEQNDTAESVSVFGNLLGNSYEGSLVGVARNTSTPEDGYVNVVGNVGFGSHKSFCHVRGPGAQQNVAVQNNVSRQDTAKLRTDETTTFSGVTVDVADGRNVTVRDNELYGYSGHGVHVNGDLSDVSVLGNGVFDPGLAGVRVAEATNGLVDRNYVVGAREAGIRLVGASDVAVRDNYVRGVGTSGILTGDGPSPAGHDVADNYVTDANRRSDGTFPAVAVHDSGVRVRGNALHPNGAPAIAESSDVDGNVYADNWARGDDPWRITGPASRVRDNVPPVDVHRDVAVESDRGVVRFEFDRRYARRPRLTFGRVGGTVEGVSFSTDDDGHYVGAEIAVEEGGGTFDVSVDEM